MQFLITDIKGSLAISDRHFIDPNEDIDILTHRLTASHNLEDMMLIATRCTSLCEKFHSYFHFEQSYFHLLLAKLYLEMGAQDDAIKQLDKAIFQDHLNHEALGLLLKQGDGAEKYKNHTASYNVKMDGSSYSRHFDNFEDFLKFALNQPRLHEPHGQSYWMAYDNYLKSSSIERLIETIDLISKSHALYHENAGRIYYNRHLIFKELGNIDLAKNDLIKAKNLDAKL